MMKCGYILGLALIALSIAGCGSGDAPPTVVAPPTAAPTPTPAPTPPPPTPAPYPAGLTSATITVGGTQRQFLVHVPPALTTTPRAIIVVLHGGGGSGTQASTLAISPQAVFRTVSDREGLVAIYPTAIDDNWNDCRSDAAGISNTVDDVGFLDAMLTRLEREYGVDSRRIFMTGTSNGAMMSMRYALERAERVAAIATSSGSLPAVPDAGRCTDGPSRAVPILMTHGEVDPLVPYAGGCVALPITRICVQGTVIGAEATRDRWLRINGLFGTTPVTTRIDTTSGDGGTAVQFRYGGSTPVDWWKLEGAGHSPPSLSVFLDRPDAGIQNRDIEFAEVAWAFFRARLP